MDLLKVPVITRGHAGVDGFGLNCGSLTVGYHGIRTIEECEWAVWIEQTAEGLDVVLQFGTCDHEQDSTDVNDFRHYSRTVEGNDAKNGVLQAFDMLNELRDLMHNDRNVAQLDKTLVRTYNMTRSI